MSKKIKGLFIIILFFLVIFIIPKTCEAVDLDEIINYTTTVSPRDDGTLDIKYHIEWKVLDSTIEGPLEWVKIGIPNQHVDTIKKLSDEIKSIKYTSDGGNYVRVNFKNKYYAGDIVTFEFSLHQSYMYSIDNSKGIVKYEFTPGWFSDIKVDQAIIQWESDGITKHNGSNGGNNYIVWSKKLAKNQKITAKVEYSVGNFKLDYNKQANGNSTKSILTLPIIFVLIVIIFTIILVLQIMYPPYYRHGGYGYYGGYYPYYYHHHHNHYGGGFGGGSSGGSRGGSSCACACACAGGGRAGCAKKDFYGTNLKIEKKNH